METAAQNIVSTIQALALRAWDAALTLDTAIQVMLVLGAFLISYLIWKPVRGKLLIRAEEMPGEWLKRLLTAGAGYGWLLPFMLLCEAASAGMAASDMGSAFIRVMTHLSAAWFAVVIIRAVVSSSFVGKGLSYAVWIMAVLHIMGLLDPVSLFLDGLGITFGETRISVLVIIKGSILGVLLLQAASVTSRVADQRIVRSDLSPSLQVLFTKALRICLFAGVGLIVISSMGISLTSFAVFSGAVGVGIGFGLQKIFSNLVSGVILLLDRSIKPGDTIEVQGAYGYIRSLHARYASVLTRDGKEYLIPNEHLITNQVINWTFSDSNVRLRLPVGITYESDLRLALKLMEESAGKCSRAMSNPPPAARLVGFGDNSVDLELRVWIRDSNMGVGGVRHEVLLAIWDAFHEHGVQMPFPQRDVLLKPDSKLTVTLDRDSGDKPGTK